MGIVYNYIRYIYISRSKIWTQTNLVWWDSWINMRWYVVMRMWWHAWIRVFFTCLDNNNKDNFDVYFLNAHPLE